jgi:hypothetical protein
MGLEALGAGFDLLAELPRAPGDDGMSLTHQDGTQPTHRCDMAVEADVHDRDLGHRAKP